MHVNKSGDQAPNECISPPNKSTHGGDDTRTDFMRGLYG